MRLVIKEAKQRKQHPSQIQFMQFVENFKANHGSYDSRNMDSRDALVNFAKENLINNQIVKTSLVTNTLIPILNSEAKKTNDYTPAQMAGTLLTRFDDWTESKKDK